MSVPVVDRTVMSCGRVRMLETVYSTKCVTSCNISFSLLSSYTLMSFRLVITEASHSITHFNFKCKNIALKCVGTKYCMGV